MAVSAREDSRARSFDRTAMASNSAASFSSEAFVGSLGERIIRRKTAALRRLQAKLCSCALSCVLKRHTSCCIDGDTVV